MLRGTLHGFACVMYQGHSCVWCVCGVCVCGVCGWCGGFGALRKKQNLTQGVRKKSIKTTKTWKPTKNNKINEKPWKTLKKLNLDIAHIFVICDRRSHAAKNFYLTQYNLTSLFSIYDIFLTKYNTSKKSFKNRLGSIPELYNFL